MISEAEMKGLCHEPVRRRLFSFLRRLVLWFLVVWLVVFIASFFFVPPLVQSQLSKHAAGSVHVQSGRMKGLTGVKLKGLVIAADHESLSTRPILRADDCQVTFSLWGLLSGTGPIKSVAANDFLISADYLVDQKQWTFEPLAFSSSGEPTGFLPRIDLQRGALRVRRIDEGNIDTITTIGFDGLLEATETPNQYRFEWVVDDRFDCAGSRLAGTYSFDDSDSLSHLSLSGSLSTHNKTMLNNCWNIQDIQLGCIFFQGAETSVDIHHCGFKMGQSEYSLTGTFGSQAGQDIHLQIKNGRLSDTAQDNTVVYAEPVISYLPTAWSQFLRDYNPAGVLDVDLRFQDKPDDFKTDVFGTINCQNASVTPRLFPYKLDDLTGEILFDGSDLKLDQLRAKHHDVDVELDGEFVDLGPNVEIRFNAKSPNLKLDQDVLTALDQSAKKVWFAFNPSGTTAFDYRFTRSQDGTKEQVLKLDILNASAVYDKFWYPLENLTGSVIVESDQVKLNNLVADFDDGRNIRLNGHASNLKDSQPKFHIEVQSQNIPVDERLTRAMPPQQRDFLKRFDVNAVADLDVDIYSSETKADAFDYNANIKLEADTFIFDGFSVPMKDVQLDVDVTQEVVRLNRFEGTADGGGKVVLGGTLMPKGADSDRPGACLNLNLKEFELNETFWGALGDRAISVIGKLRPSGKVNVNGLLEINASEKECKATDLKVDFMDNPLVWDQAQYGRLAGAVRIMENVIQFKDFSVHDVPLETLPDELLIEKLKRLHSQIRPQGSITVQIEQGTVEVAGGALASLDIIGGIDLMGASGGKYVKNLTGGIDAHLEMGGPDKTWQAIANYEIDHFLYRNWTVSRLKGHMTYDPSIKELASHGFTANFYNGSVKGSFDMNLAERDNATYTLKTTYENVDVSTFLMAGHENEAPKVYTGLAEGLLNLNGKVDDLRGSQGELVINIRDMQLGNQSLLGKVLTAIQFKQPENFVFNELEFQSEIDGSNLICERVRIVGKPLIFYGSGTLNLDQRKIVASLVAFDKIVGDEASLLNMLARGVGSALWKIEVSGDLDDPVVDPVYLSVLKSPLNIFKKRKIQTPEASP